MMGEGGMSCFAGGSPSELCYPGREGTGVCGKGNKEMPQTLGMKCPRSRRRTPGRLPEAWKGQDPLGRHLWRVDF